MMGLQLIKEYTTSQRRFRALARRSHGVEEGQRVKREKDICSRNTVVSELESEVIDLEK